MGKICINCNDKRASFNHSGEKYPRYCGGCKSPDMINVVHKYCICCNIKYASYNYPGLKNPLYCGQCKLESMVGVTSSHNKKINSILDHYDDTKIVGVKEKDTKHKSGFCIGCSERSASFNYPNESKRLYCKYCSLEGMVNVKNYKKMCIGCSERQAYFNFPNETKRSYCSPCKLDGMVYVKPQKNKKTLDADTITIKRDKKIVQGKTGQSSPEGKDDVEPKKLCIACLKMQPRYDYFGEEIPKYCKSCKLKGMINFTTKKCVTCKKKMPGFNYPREKEAVCCNDCKLDGMVSIRRQKGIVCPCVSCKKVTANYNFQNDTRRLYCKSCKLDGMVDIVHKKCLGCAKKIANFNHPGETEKLYCKSCKLDGMVNVQKNEMCNGCSTKLPSFNYLGHKKPKYCGPCALDGMVDVRNPKCGGCEKKRPNYNYPGEKGALYCNDCKLDGMVNVISEKCIKCLLKHPSFNYIGKKKALYCSPCALDGMVDVRSPKFTCKSCHLEWTKQTKTQDICSYCNPDSRKKTKENRVKVLLQKNNIIAVNDKVVRNGCCLKYRPDFVIDCKTYFLVVEVDENAHNSYDSDCEAVRMNNIAHSLGLPTKFIRYNPDKKGISKKYKETELLITINTFLNLNVLEDPEVVYLFY